MFSSNHFEWFVFCGVLNVNWWKGKSETNCFVWLFSENGLLFRFAYRIYSFSILKISEPVSWNGNDASSCIHLIVNVCQSLFLTYQLICLIWINTLANNSTETHLNDNMTSNMQIKCLTSEWNSYFHVFTHRGNLCLPI